MNAVTVLAPKTGHQSLAATRSVDVSGVEERNALLECGTERRQRLLVVDRTPRSADRPGTEPDR
jgi:hypothetical protein